MSCTAAEQVGDAVGDAGCAEADGQLAQAGEGRVLAGDNRDRSAQCSLTGKMSVFISSSIELVTAAVTLSATAGLVCTCFPAAR